MLGLSQGQHDLLAAFALLGNCIIALMLAFLPSLGFLQPILDTINFHELRKTRMLYTHTLPSSAIPSWAIIAQPVYRQIENPNSAKIVPVFGEILYNFELNQLVLWLVNTQPR